MSAADLPHGPTWLDGLAEHLASRGFGTYRAAAGDHYRDDDPWPFYIEHLPADGYAIALFGYGGTEARVGAEPTVQARIRGDRDPRTSRRHAEAIRAYLHQLTGGVVLADGSHLVCAPNPSGVVHLGPDGNGRHEHTTSHRLTIDPPEGSTS